MLESHHSLVVKALQKLYKNCVNNEGFPGEPLAESANGHPLTHEILDRLGLIRQAEETDEPDEESEDLQYLKSLSTSTESSATTDPSPEPITPPEPSSSNCSPVDPPQDGGKSFKWGFPLFPPATSQADQVHDYSDPNYQQHTMMMSRQALGTAGNLGGDMPPSSSCPGNVPLPSGLPSHHNIPYWYYDAGGCNEQDLVKAHNIHPPMMTGLDPHQTAAGLPVDMLNNYHLHFQEQQQQQALYTATSLAPGWTFAPSG